MQDTPDESEPQSDAEVRFPHFVVVTIWEHIEPIARGERYEGPLLDCSQEVVHNRASAFSSAGEQLQFYTEPEVPLG